MLQFLKMQDGSETFLFRLRLICCDVIVFVKYSDSILSHEQRNQRISVIIFFPGRVTEGQKEKKKRKERNDGYLWAGPLTANKQHLHEHSNRSCNFITRRTDLLKTGRVFTLAYKNKILVKCLCFQRKLPLRHTQNVPDTRSCAIIIFLSLPIPTLFLQKRNSKYVTQCSSLVRPIPLFGCYHQIPTEARLNIKFKVIGPDG